MNGPSNNFSPLNKAQQDSFFIKSLNQVYCAKSHLEERLPEISPLAHFADLLHAIDETLDEVNQQITRIDKIFEIVGVKPDFDSCDGLVFMFDAAFDAIQQMQSQPQERDLAILFYLAAIESIELASFKLLKLGIPRQHAKEIRQLLKENADDAQDDLALLLYITRRYFK